MEKEEEIVVTKDVSPIDERIKAIVSAAAIIIVNVAALFFGITLDAGVITNAFLAIAMLVATIWGIWHNHNFTPEAAEAQQVLNGLKEAKKQL